jgi:hypothetical protein
MYVYMHIYINIYTIIIYMHIWIFTCGVNTVTCTTSSWGTLLTGIQDHSVKVGGVDDGTQGGVRQNHAAPATRFHPPHVTALGSAHIFTRADEGNCHL